MSENGPEPFFVKRLPYHAYPVVPIENIRPGFRYALRKEPGARKIIGPYAQIHKGSRYAPMVEEFLDRVEMNVRAPLPYPSHSRLKMRDQKARLEELAKQEKFYAERLQAANEMLIKTRRRVPAANAGAAAAAAAAGASSTPAPAATST
jgi:hypothetical protein